jgi:O-antigen/teichoic acid export membrane protein
MRNQSVLRSLAWMGGASFIGQIITWSVTIIVARLLSPEDYGLVAISGLFTVFAHSICLMGISSAVIQAKSVSDYQLRALYGFSILMGVFMFFLGLLAAPGIARIFNDPRLTALVSFQNLVFLFGAPKSLQWSMLARETRFDVIAKIETGSRILTSGCALAMAALGFGFWTLASQWILIELFQFIGFSFHRRITPTFVIRWGEIRELLIFGVQIFLRNSIGQLYASLDVFLFGKLASASFLGAYTFSKQLTNIPFEKIVTIINRVLLPYLSSVKNDMESMRAWTLMVADLQALFLAPFFYLLFFCAEETVLILLGENWIAAVLPLQIFCVANVFKLAESYAMLALTALGRVAEQVRFIFFQLVVVGGAMFGLAIWVEVDISMYVWVTIYPFVCFIFCKVLLKAIGLGLSTIMRHLKATLIAHAALIVSVYGLNLMLVGPHWLTLVAKITVGCVVYFLCLLAIDREKIMHLLQLVLPFISRRTA